ncbi:MULTISPECIES: hypothetical protein [Pseudoalteromonas]|uniref:Nickel uptake transporter family protein n=1 Tax=Pseudoalteromonas haloplanktis TaxID=228 RepID=A0ABU1BEB9_PSEHA|nr:MULTISPECIES: hypothetical protein [Pseudoalteromonas]MCF6144177.1 hypothetical protein [Pseudoalteromonas mariniglutinosa NCIMB 1770]MDQ9092645.1 hypothetical protein [Pseudoalteromonas haloplanktis]BDF96492.1 hypothetical protein KAN5_33300 [Pseudoalteromonas sp. KAN5]
MKSLKNSLFIAALLTCSNFAIAHEIWLVKSAKGDAVKLYLGEPGEPESGDKIAGLKNTKVFVDSTESTLALTQQQNFWSAELTEQGDVRAFTDDLWKPWKMEKVSEQDTDTFQAAKLFAKAGREEIQAKQELEFVPTKSNGDTFTLVYKNKPVVDHEVLVQTPKHQVKTITDKHGQLTVTSEEQGTYIISSDHPVAGKAVIAGNQVDSTYNIVTISFQVK